MGFSVSAATALLLVGFMFSIGTLTTGLFSAQQAVQEAGRSAELRGGEFRQGSLSIVSVQHNPGLDELTVVVTNTGSVTFHTDGVDLVVDGVPSNAIVTSKLVEGGATKVWAPATDLEIKATLEDQPANVVIVAPTGAAAFWRI